MIPEVWGPYFWHTMHFVAEGYPENPTYKNKIEYTQFYKSIIKVLPCKSCSRNFKRHAKKYDIKNYLKSRKRLMKWVYLVHNEVNKELKKRTVYKWSNVWNKHKKIKIILNKK